MLHIGYKRFIPAARVVNILPFSRFAWKAACASGRAIYGPLRGQPPRSLIEVDALAGPVLVRSSVRPESLSRRLKEITNAKR